VSETESFDAPVQVGRKSSTSGTMTGRSRSGTETGSQLSQWMIGI
jgi:hypothetical protein